MIMKPLPHSARRHSMIALAASCLAGMAQAPKAEPLLVDDRGFISRVEFDGNEAFSDGVLRRALAIDMTVLLASHPAAELSGYLAAISKQLTAGYRHEGFPDATAEAAVAPHAAGGPVVVHIHEGRRYVMGDIRIEGTRELSPEKLRNKLMGESGTDSEQLLVDLIRGIMNENASALPKDPAKEPAEPAAEIPEERAEPAMDPLVLLKSRLSGSSSTTADWTPGKPLDFSQKENDPFLEEVQGHLATLGRPLTVAHTSIEKRADGKADLLIRIEKEGPPALTGRIRVIGGSAHTAEEITAAAGLSGGQPFTPGLIDHAMVALWNSGRFFPFAIDLEPRDKDAGEIDISIQVREIPGVPRLDAKLPPEQEAAQRFIRMLNDWGASGTGNDLVLRGSKAHGLDFHLGISSRDGMVIKANAPDKDIRVHGALTANGIGLDLTTHGRDEKIRLPLPLNRVIAQVQILPTIDDEKQALSIWASAGLSPLGSPRSRPFFQFVVTPAMPLIKPEYFRLEGDRFVDFVQKGETWIRLDMTTGMPVEDKTSLLGFQQGMVAEQQKTMSEDSGPSGGVAGVHAWLATAATYLPVIAEANGADMNKLQPMVRWLRLSAALSKPSLLQPFAGIWEKWNAEPEHGKSFFIPTDTEKVSEEVLRSGNASLLVGLGVVSLSESLAPPDSWVSKFSRELLFIQCGSTQYTAATMERLLADPTMGPIGCYLASQLLPEDQTTIANRFLQKALKQATANGFRKDWRLLLDAPMGFGETLNEVCTALAAITAEDEKEITKLLDPAQSRWFHGFLTHLRQRPGKEEFSSWISPQMDALWDHLLNGDFRKRIEQQIKPPPDPKEVIAMVNGQAVPRVWVSTVTASFPGTIEDVLPSSKPDRAKPWTRKPALAAAIRLTLLSPWMKTAHPDKLDQFIRQITAEKAAKLAGDTDTDWIATFGMTRRQLGLLIGAAWQVDQLRKEIPEPDEDSLEKWWNQQAKRLGRSGHVHSLRMKTPGDTAQDAAYATELVRESSNLLHEGLPFIALMAASNLDEECGLVANCNKETLPIDLKSEVFRKVISLQPGEVTPVIMMGDIRWVAMLMAWNETPSPELGEIRDQVTAAWKDEQFRSLVSERLATLEKSAVVDLLDQAAEAEMEKHESVFQQLLKTSPQSPVARLGIFWQLVLKKDPGAAKALDELTTGESLGEAALDELAKALEDRELPDLAARCRASR